MTATWSPGSRRAAAAQAAALGAHREAAAQYERALRFPPDDPAALAELYDGYADAARLRRLAGRRPPRRASARSRSGSDSATPAARGTTSRKLCSVYWRLCRGPESVAAIERAIELLEPLGDDPELACAYSAQAFNLWATDPDAGQRDARARATRWPTRLGDPVVLSDVLNNVAVRRVHPPRGLDRPMHEALRLALEAGAEAQAGRAYANAYTFFIAQYRFAEGERFWRDGIAYCDERDITTYSTCLRGHRAVALLDVGQWDDAAALAERVLATEASPVNLLTSQVTLGLVRARRGCRRRSTCSTPPSRRPTTSTRPSGSPSPGSPAPRRTGSPGTTTAAAEPTSARIRAVITPMEYDEDARLSVWEQRLLGAATPASPAPSPGRRGSPATTPPLPAPGTTSAAATTPPWRSTTPTATTTCARRSPASRHSAPTPPPGVPASG